MRLLRFLIDIFGGQKNLMHQLYPDQSPFGGEINIFPRVFQSLIYIQDERDPQETLHSSYQALSEVTASRARGFIMIGLYPISFSLSS